MRCTPHHLAITVVALCLGLGTVRQAGAHEGPTRADGLGDVHFVRCRRLPRLAISPLASPCIA
jgi:hypothetical protein